MFVNKKCVQTTKQLHTPPPLNVYPFVRICKLFDDPSLPLRCARTN